jgi:phage-related protein
MTFDAGAIEATLKLKRDQFQRDLKAERDDLRKFASEKYSASLDLNTDRVDAALSKLEARFDALRQLLERRIQLAASERVSGSGGGVGGPGIVGADPLLLKKLEQSAATPGGIGILGTGTDTTLHRLLRQQLENAANQKTSPPLQGTGVAGSDTNRILQQVLRNTSDGNNNGGGSAGSDAAVIADAAASRGISSFLSGLLRRGGSSGGGGGGSDTSGNAASGGFLRKLLGGIGPGVAGIGAKPLLLGTGITAGLAALPALAGGLAPLGIGAVGVGAGAAILKGAYSNIAPFVQKYQQAQTALQTATTPQQKLAAQQQMQGAVQGAQAQGGSQFQAFKAINSIQDSWQKFTAGFAPSLAKVLSQVSTAFHGLLPTLNTFFHSAVGLIQPVLGGLTGLAKTVLPELASAFRIVAPDMRPIISGITQLISGLLTGLMPLLKAAGPAVRTLGSAFALIGRDIGQMFKLFAPVIKDSDVILKALLDIVGALFPIIGKLAAVFAKALAPVFLDLAKIVISLLPFITKLGHVLAALGGAVLGDLVSAFGAIAKLLIDLSPSFQVLASVAGDLFNTLENSGVFSILGDALEKLAKPLANLINAVVIGLAPALPPLISLISILSGVLITLLADGLNVMIVALTDVVKFLTPILPLLTFVITAIKLWSIVQGLLNIALDANPIGVLVLAVAALIGIVVELVKHWAGVATFFTGLWHDIRSIFDDAMGHIEHALSSAWNAVWRTIKSVWDSIWRWFKSWWYVVIPAVFTGGLGAIVGLIVKYHTQIWHAIKSAWDNIVNFFQGVPGDIMGALKGLGVDLLNFGRYVMDDLLHGIKDVWGDITGFFSRLPGDILHAIGIHSPPHWAIQAGRDIMHGLGIGMSQAHSAVTNASAALVSKVSGNAAAIQRLMQQMAAKRGWTGGQWDALNSVEMREAGYKLNAQNASSGAYGLAQFINGPSEYASYGGNASTAAGQITGMLNYIAQRYGTPQAAWNHEVNFGWYDSGGPLMPGVTLAINKTGKPEQVLTAGESALFAEAMRSGSRGPQPLIGTYQTAFYGTGDTTSALREFTRTLKVAQMQSVVTGP